MSEKIRAIRVELFVPDEVAKGTEVAGRALVFAKFACMIDDPGTTSVKEIAGGTIVSIEENDFAFTRRAGKRRTE